VKERLKGVVNFVLYHNRKIANRVDDSVVRVSNNRVLMIRRSRGYAPLWIKVKGRRFVHSVAVGAELQNAGAVGFDDKVVLTQYIGDTDELESLEELEKYLEFFSKLYSLRPKIVVSDKNPGYQSSYLAQKLAERYNAELVRIQHHYAHVLSVAADHGLEEGVGIAIDGIGYGDNGNAWGGEVIKFSGEKYERIYHLRYVPYVGGDVNALRPKRMLALFLSQFMGFDEIRGLTGLKDVELAFLEKAVKRRGLMTSSLGRFLDAVSAFLGVCDLRTYEGEPAMKLEASARGGKLLDMEIPLVGEEIDTVRAFQWMIENWGKYRVNDLAYTVQYKVGEALVKAALKLSPESILVSGGAAVNEYVLKGIAENSEGVPVLTPRRVPAGDGGIALGQIYYTAFMS
ncbi:MAG: carbamoyltransferase HypF, partial [Candidatus Aramenus sp.]|nr:carbamoyltransferase HypF [Candidatus Aramenus sp.]